MQVCELKLTPLLLHIFKDIEDSMYTIYFVCKDILSEP